MACDGNIQDDARHKAESLMRLSFGRYLAYVSQTRCSDVGVASKWQE